MAECKNDCRLPLAFPKKVENRPTLPRIDYRIGAYSEIREAFFRKLNQNPVLLPWTYRGADDPGIAMMEGASILADILTFYQDVYANELYLQTATLPISIAELVRLIGYRLNPGVGGRGVFAFEVGGAKPITIPAGFPVTADVTGLESPADFETVDPLVAVPALSKFPLYRPFTVPAIASGTLIFAANTAALAAADITLDKGDRLMLADSPSSPSYHQVAVVDKVETHFEHTEITIKGAWLARASVTSISAFKLGRDFRHFGHNAPPTKIVVTNGTANQQNVDFTRTVGSGVGVGSSSKLGSSSQDYPLDSQVDDLGRGTKLIVVATVSPGESKLGGDFLKSTSHLPPSDFEVALRPSDFEVFAVRTVTAVGNGTQTRGSLTGGTTIVRLNQNISDGWIDFADIRDIQIHEVTGGPFTLTNVRTATPAAAVIQLYFFGNGEDYKALDSRRLQFVRPEPKPGQEPAFEETTVSITQSAISDPAVSTLRPVALSPALQKFAIAEFPLSFPPDKPPVLAYGNLSVATQGKTDKPVALGNGDARVAFQTFAIPKAPLTYLLSNSATPPEVPQLSITVDGIEWTEVPSFIGRGPKEQIYIVREDSAGQSYVQFGDGETGGRTSSGVGNVVITYRTGIAAYGPLKPGATADAGARLTGIDAVALLDQVTGGATAEVPAKARVSAPGKIQSLGRLVSIRDFETETLAIPGVSAASAAWEILDGVPTIAITVLMETGRASELSTVTQLLNTYNACRGPQRYPISVRAGVRRFVFVDIAVSLAPGYLEEKVFPLITGALTAVFAAPPRTFGESEYRLRIEGLVQNVTGIAWNNVTALGDLGPADNPALLSLPAPPRTLAQTISCANDTLLALFPAHLSLSAVAPPVKVCG
jgi:hypothetical protein